VTDVSRLFDLAGKTALVTGGSKGLGRQMALGFARAGADVLIASRKVEACEQVAEEIRSSTGRRAEAFGVHLGRWDEIPGLVDFAYEKFGKLDVLVNNAGISPAYDTIEDVSEKLFDTIVNINFKGPFRLTQLVGSRMAADGGGSIINISSTGSIRVNEAIIPYAGAKRALNAITEGFAMAYGPNVRVNTLMPGPFKTTAHPEWADGEESADEQSGQLNSALGRFGRPQEIVGAAIFLASDASSFTTGSIVRADGGMP
jgi:NAD(P)-dependent dehydrogenase (short-subunit alcohol dehydrogenase family)